MREIKESEIDHWKQHGYVIVEEFLSTAELVACRENLARYLPSWDEYVERGPLFADRPTTTRNYIRTTRTTPLFTRLAALTPWTSP
jgi:hypothetical protein